MIINEQVQSWWLLYIYLLGTLICSSHASQSFYPQISECRPGHFRPVQGRKRIDFNAQSTMAALSGRCGLRWFQLKKVYKIIPMNICLCVQLKIVMYTLHSVRPTSCPPPPLAARLILLASCHYHSIHLSWKNCTGFPFHNVLSIKWLVCFRAINGFDPAYLSELLHVYTVIHYALLLTSACWKSNNTNTRLVASALFLALDTFGILSKTFDTAQPCHLSKPESSCCSICTDQCHPCING